MKSKYFFQWWLGIILVIAVFTRFYNLWDSLQFQGDQGRDAIIVSRIFTKLDPVFIGPVTSVGNMYLGPFYYYFMLPFLALTYPSPIGPVYAVAALGVLTSYLIYKLGKEMVGQLPALIGTTLYTLSATATMFARFSWNPNPAPFVSLLTVYYTWRALTKSGWNWWVVGLGVSILLQLHYVTLLAAVAAAGIWFWQISSNSWSANQKNFNFKNWWQLTRAQWLGTGLAMLIFLASLTPLILFDWRHNWLNGQALQALIFKDKTFEAQTAITPLAKFLKILQETDGRSMQILAEINLGKQREFNRLVVILILIGLVRAIWQTKPKDRRAGLVILTIFLAVGILGTAVYQYTVFDHYIAYLFPISALVSGVALTQLTKLKLFHFKIGPSLLAICLIGFAAINLPKMPLRTAGWTVVEIWQTSQTISDRVKPGEKYNLILLSESRDLDAQNYRYFLTTQADKSPVQPEERGNIETLFIINEEQKTKAVTSLPIYEIVTFPNKIPSEVYQIPDGPEITVLRRYSQPQN